MNCGTAITKSVPSIVLISGLVGIGFLLWNSTDCKWVAVGWIEQSVQVSAGWESIELCQPWDGVVHVAVPPVHERSTLGQLDVGRWAVVVGQHVYQNGMVDVLLSRAIRTMPLRRQALSVSPNEIAAFLMSNHLIALVVGGGILLAAPFFLRIVSIVCYGLAAAVIGFHAAVISSGVWTFSLSDDVLVGVSLLLFIAGIIHASVCPWVVVLLGRMIMGSCLLFMFPALIEPFCVAPAVFCWLAGLAGLVFPPVAIALFAAALLAGGFSADGPSACLILVAAFLVSTAVWRLSNRRCATALTEPVVPSSCCVPA